MENIITKLSNIYQHFNELQKQQLQGNARRLFYLLAQLIDDDVKRCYPAIQFFSSAIEMLGKVCFIRLANWIKYSRMDEVKFVEYSLQKIPTDHITSKAVLKVVFHNLYFAHS